MYISTLSNPCLVCRVSNPTGTLRNVGIKRLAFITFLLCVEPIEKFHDHATSTLFSPCFSEWRWTALSNRKLNWSEHALSASAHHKCMH